MPAASPARSEQSMSRPAVAAGERISCGSAGELSRAQMLKCQSNTRDGIKNEERLKTGAGPHPFAFVLIRGASSAPTFDTPTKKPAQGGLFQLWRRRRDSNPRYAINVYSLSRGAPSATRPLLQIPLYCVSYSCPSCAPKSRVTRCLAPRAPGRRRAAGAPSQS